LRKRFDLLGGGDLNTPEKRGRNPTLGGEASSSRFNKTMKNAVTEKVHPEWVRTVDNIIAEESSKNTLNPQSP
jgi:hypothetical protein